MSIVTAISKDKWRQDYRIFNKTLVIFFLAPLHYRFKHACTWNPYLANHYRSQQLTKKIIIKKKKKRIDGFSSENDWSSNASSYGNIRTWAMLLLICCACYSKYDSLKYYECNPVACQDFYYGRSVDYVLRTLPTTAAATPGLQSVLSISFYQYAYRFWPRDL